MSGESLRAMIVRERCRVTVVFSGGGGSSSSPFCGAQPSSTASRASRRKRLPGLNVAPRPLIGAVGSPLKVASSDQLRIEGDRRVDHARQRTVRFGAGGDLGEFRG